MKVETIQGAGKECLSELTDVLRRYEGRLYRDDAKDILAHLAMVFEGQAEKGAALLLHETGMDVAFFHGLAQGWTDSAESKEEGKRV